MEPVFIVLLIAVLSLGLVVGFMVAAAMAEGKIDSLSKELAEHESDSVRLYWESRWLEGFNAGATARDNTVQYYDNPYEIEDDAEHDGWKCGWRYWEYILTSDRSAEDDVEYTKRYPYGGNTPVIPDVGKSRMMRECCGGSCHQISPSKADPVDMSGSLEPGMDHHAQAAEPTILSMGLPGVAKAERCQDVPSDSSPVIFEEDDEPRG